MPKTMTKTRSKGLRVGGNVRIDAAEKEGFENGKWEQFG